MKKVVCLQNVYYEGRYLNAGVDVGLPDDVARNWVKRGLAKPVGEETPVNPPAVPPVEKPVETSAVPPELTPEVKPDEIAETPVSPNEEKGGLRYDFTTPIPATATEDTPVADVDTPKRGRPPKKNHGGKRK